MSKDEGDASGDADAGPKPLGGGGESKGGQQSQKDELGSTSKEPGTGTQYVKSSGLAAEGGDFDATKPGAGKEADRKFSLVPAFLLHSIWREIMLIDRRVAGGKGYSS